MEGTMITDVRTWNMTNSSTAARARSRNAIRMRLAELEEEVSYSLHVSR